MEKYKTLIETSLSNAENNISNISQEIIDLDGMSGTKTRHFYNNLLNTDDARYLEIGVWKGSSTCSAMYKNKANVICIFQNYPNLIFTCMMEIIRMKVIITRFYIIMIV